MVFNNITEEEPPIQQNKFKSAGTKVQTAVRAVFSVPKLAKSTSIIPVVLIFAVALANVAQGRSYSTNISSYVVMEPKTKISAMNAIDQFTPFVEESRDAEPVVVADLTPDELVLTKPSLAKTERRPEEVVVPVKRDTVVTHTVQPGETLSDIAANYDLKVASVQVENSEMASIDRLKVGEELDIPVEDYDQSYIDKKLKVKTTVAKAKAASTDTRAVAVRGTSTARSANNGQPAFARPAGSLGQNGYHSWALDIPPSGGTGIFASAAGVVVEVGSGWNGGYGSKIVIDHGSGWQTLYSHLSEISVSAGQSVGKGQVIGVMGATGRTYPKGAVHLHFEIRQNGVRLNPIHYIQ